MSYIVVDKTVFDEAIEWVKKILPKSPRMIYCAFMLFIKLQMECDMSKITSNPL
jgi:hypothetical protein